MGVGHFADVIAQFRGIIEEAERAIGMNGEIIPRRHDFAVLLLGRIPRRADVSVRSQKYHQRLKVRLDPLPLRIGARQMSQHRP
jgi:hypothetical protein